MNEQTKKQERKSCVQNGPNGDLHIYIGYTEINMPTLKTVRGSLYIHSIPKKDASDE